MESVDSRDPGPSDESKNRPLSIICLSIVEVVCILTTVLRMLNFLTFSNILVQNISGGDTETDGKC